MLPSANAALLDIIKNGRDESTRLKAVTVLYDRLGFQPETANMAAKRVREQIEQEHQAKVPVGDMPPDDAPEEEWIRFLSSVSLDA